MPDLPTKSPSPQIAEFLKRQTTRARLAFILDATASRGPTWDLAAQLQTQMFEEAAARRAGDPVNLLPRVV